MNKHQDFFAKTQNKADFSSGVIRSPQKSSSNAWIFILMILLIGGGAAVRFFGLHTHFQMPGIEQDLQERENRPYLIGEEITIEGLLKEDNSDLVAYTHTLTDNEGTTFFLKSKTIPLNNYSSSLSGTIQILGKVEAFYHATPIVEVQSIGTQTSEEITATTGSETIEEVSNPGIYLSQAGLYFGHNFFENYVFIGQAGANNTIEIKNLENEKITKISFFTCKNSGDKNCQDLTKAFKNISAKEITNEDGVSFFKDGEVKNRFFQNNNWRGYFIIDAEDSEVEKLIPMIKVLNPEYIKDLVNHNGIKACLGTDNGLNSIYQHSINKTNDGLLVIMEGKGEKNFTCQALVDPSQSTNFKFVDLQTKANDATTGTLAPEAEKTPEKQPEKPAEKADENNKKPTAQTTSQASGKDPSIKQFPIHEDKVLTYTSSRGNYKMDFPSMNIAYEAANDDADLGEAGFRCKYSIKVIQYKNKDLIKSEPTLTIYECANKKKLTAPKANYLIKELGDKQFVIEIHDGAWRDFAEHIGISAL